MGIRSKKRHDLESEIGITAVLIFAWFFFGIIFTVFYYRDVALAEADYMTAEAVVTSVGGPEIYSYSRNPYKKTYIRFYYCRFVDKNGISRSGVICSRTKEENNWKYWHDDTVTIYYSADFKDGDRVFDDLFVYPNPLYYFWPWGFLIITLIIFFQKRNAYYS